MARNYRPLMPFNVPMKLLVPSSVVIKGTTKKVFPDPEDIPDSEIFFSSFRTYGGTESTRDGVYTLINTAVIDTWFRPDIKADCQIYLCETDQTYEILNDPEDIDMRHQYMKIKVRKVGGKP